MSDLAYIPAPSEATWVGDWNLVGGSCGQQYWARYFGGRSWTVGTTSIDPIEVELAGSQFSDGSIKTWVCLEGVLDLNADEALMLAATLTHAADELGHIEGGTL